MPNGKGAPDCHYCRYHAFGRTLENSMLNVGRSIRFPICAKHNSSLPLVNEQRICSAYDSIDSEGQVSSIEAFFHAFHVDPAPGVLYVYFYNDTWMRELMDLTVQTGIDVGS